MTCSIRGALIQAQNIENFSKPHLLSLKTLDSVLGRLLVDGILTTAALGAAKVAANRLNVTPFCVGSLVGFGLPLIAITELSLSAINRYAIQKDEKGATVDENFFKRFFLRLEATALATLAVAFGISVLSQRVAARAVENMSRLSCVVKYLPPASSFGYRQALVATTAKVVSSALYLFGMTSLEKVPSDSPKVSQETNDEKNPPHSPGDES